MNSGTTLVMICAYSLIRLSRNWTTRQRSYFRLNGISVSKITPKLLLLHVRQKQPKTLDEAVMCTLETEIYLRDSRGAKSAVSAVEVPVAATRTIPAEQENLVKMMQSLVERLERLEASEGRGGRTRNRSGRDRDSKEPVICYKCGKEGHFARGCASGEQRRQQGN